MSDQTTQQPSGFNLDRLKIGFLAGSLNAAIVLFKRSQIKVAALRKPLEPHVVLAETRKKHFSLVVLTLGFVCTELFCFSFFFHFFLMWR